MHSVVLVLHSLLRWLVLVSTLLVLVTSAHGVIFAYPWTRAHGVLGRIWVAAFDLQLTLGLTLFVAGSPVVAAAFAAGPSALKHPILRFFALEHGVTMLIAAAVLHGGWLAAKRHSNDRSRHRLLSVTGLLVLAIVGSAVPWPTMAHGRPALRRQVLRWGMGRCEAPPSTLQSNLPAELSNTGLYADIGSGQLAPSVKPYAPRFELWSDGATKRRFIELPEGSRIDTSDPNAWDFPQGTKLWKEFSRDGRRLETRLLWKRGPARSDWAQMSYVWTDDQREAIATPTGHSNVGHTDHDVPSAAECSGCHGGAPSPILGFSAIQLAYDAPGLDLDDLVAEDRLTVAPGVIEIPGDPVTVDAVGTLHANCGHCHNPNQGRRDRSRCYDPKTPFDFSLRVEDLGAVTDLAVVRTATGSAILPGDPDRSPIIQRMRRRGGFVPGMPPLASEVPDQAALRAISEWIREGSFVHGPGR